MTIHGFHDAIAERERKRERERVWAARQHAIGKGKLKLHSKRD